MARLPRYALPRQSQHIIQRGNNRQVIFASDTDLRFFRDAKVRTSDQLGLAIYAYVWAGSHIHRLATPEQEQSTSKVFPSVGHKYVQSFNTTCQRNGTLWAGRYQATVVDSEPYLLTVIRYFELEPVHAGLAAHPRH